MVRLLDQLHVVFFYFFLQARQKSQIFDADALNAEFFAAMQLLQRFLDGFRQIFGVGIFQLSRETVAANYYFLQLVLIEQDPEIAPFDGRGRIGASEKEVENQQHKYDEPQKIAAHSRSGTAARFIRSIRSGS